MLADLLHPGSSFPFLCSWVFVVPVSVCRCFMGPSSAADAALFLEMVCGTVALARCLRFVVSMGPGSSAPAANGVLDLVFAFCWFRSIGPCRSYCCAVLRYCVLQHCASLVLAFGFCRSHPASFSVLYVARGPCVWLYVSQCLTLHDHIHL